MKYLSPAYLRIRIIDLTFSAALLLLTGMLFLSYHIKTELAQSNLLTEHTYEVIMAVDQLNNSLLQAESSRRGYILTGNVQQKAQYQLYAQKVLENFEQVKKLTLDNSDQQQRLSKLHELISRKLTIFRDSITAYDRDGFRARQQAQLTEEGTLLMIAVRSGISDIKEHEKTLLTVRRAQERSSLQTLIIVVLSGISIAIVLLAHSFYIARHETSNHQLAARALESANKDISDLSSMMQLLQTCATFPEARDILSSYGASMFPEDNGGIYLLNPSRTLMTDLAAWGSSPMDPFTPDRCWALRLGQPHASLKESDVRCQHVSPGDRGHICIPLAAHHETLGVLHLELNKGEGAEGLKKKEGKALAFAEQVALAIRNLQLREQLRELSIRDPLTGLLNRRHMEESLIREISRSARTKLPLSVLMLDIDHFKRFNDTFGHEAGDHVLKEVGQQLQKLFRGSDIACRLGGEEFTVILPEADCEKALETGNRIREAVKGLPLFLNRQPLGTVTISAGIAVYPADGDTIQQLLSRADEALYEAKRKGRDRVESGCTIVTKLRQVKTAPA